MKVPVRPLASEICRACGGVHSSSWFRCSGSTQSSRVTPRRLQRRSMAATVRNRLNRIHYRPRISTGSSPTGLSLEPDGRKDQVSVLKSSAPAADRPARDP